MRASEWFKLLSTVPISYLRSKQFRTRPVQAIIDVSLKCPASCKYCATWMIEHEDLNTDEINLIIRRLRKMGVTLVALSGGEPMIRRDLPQFVKTGVDLGMMVSTITSGLVDNEQRFRELMENGVSVITFTIDGIDKEMHETFRNDTDFDRLISAVKTAMAVREKGGFKTRINSQTVITRHNIEHLPEIVAMGDELGVDHCSFQPVWPTLDFDNFVREFGFDENDKELLETARDQLRSVPNANLKEFIDLLPDFYLDYPRIRKEIECYAGRAFVHVNYKGELLPCAFYPESFGSLVDHEPEELLEGEHHARLLEEAADQSGCGGCSLTCHMERNLMLRSVSRPSAWPQLLTERFRRRSAR